MITHTWTVEKLECSPLLAGFENVVRTVYWLLTSSDGTTIVSTNGVTNLGFDPENSNFVNYSGLSEETVIGWLHGELTPEAVIGVEQEHERTIVNTPAPEIIAIPLPWASN